MNLAIVLKHFVKWNTENKQTASKCNLNLFSRLNCAELKSRFKSGCYNINCWNCPLLSNALIQNYEDITEPSNNPISDQYPILIYLLKRIPDE